MVKEQTIILSSGSNVSSGNASFSTTEQNKLIFKLPNGLSLTDKHEIALKSISTPYSWRNITSALNNNSFHYQLEHTLHQLKHLNNNLIQIIIKKN